MCIQIAQFPFNVVAMKKVFAAEQESLSHDAG
jgi:hypothetical protein